MFKFIKNWFTKDKQKALVPSQKTSRLRLMERLRKKQKSSYLAECEIIYKGEPLSRVTLHTMAHSAVKAEDDINNNIELKVSRVFKQKNK
jgi:hypothetical protein